MAVPLRHRHRPSAGPNVARAVLACAMGATLTAAAPFGGASAPPDAPVALVPGIAFAWTAPGTDGLLAFQLRPGPGGLDRLVAVRLPARGVSLAGYRLDPDAGSLLLRVRAERAGELPVRSLELDLRYAPGQTVPVRRAEVVALPDAHGPLALDRWASDDDAGLYAAFSLENRGAVPVTVRTLRYAPARLGQGLVLAATGPASAFGPWKDRVLRRTEAAFAAYLRAGGRDPHRPDRTLAPRALAFPLTGPLASARWRASNALDVTVRAGDALFLAVTPAAFSDYVGALAVTAYPVLGYDGERGCCRLQGVPAPILNVVAAQRAAGRTGTP